MTSDAAREDGARTPGDPVLIVEGLRKRYRTATGAVEVLRQISFSAAAGEMVAIVGVSGAGKSTLLHLIGGLDAADAGAVRLGELEITRAAGAELARLRNREIGFVFQAHRLLPDLTALENVALPRLIARAGRAASCEQAARLLAEVGLAGIARRPVTELSAGEQQRVAIARALIMGPRLVLADEPTGSLDAEAAERCGDLLAALCRARRTVTLIATHSERLARKCDRRFVLADGRLQRAGVGDGG